MNKKELLRKKRHTRIRMKVRGKTQRPRIVILRSAKNFTAQAIDDEQNKTLLSMATFSKVVRPQIPNGGNLKAAENFGAIFAKKMKEKGISRIVFDRAGYAYHGRVKAFAEALRKEGLEF